MELYAMKKRTSLLVLEVLLVPALLLLLLLPPGAKCHGSQGGGGGGGANLTVTGTVFCDACSSSSFSNHSYFLPGTVVYFRRWYAHAIMQILCSSVRIWEDQYSIDLRPEALIGCYEQLHCCLELLRTNASSRFSLLHYEEFVTNLHEWLG
jgi:hypothetical protein